MAYAYGMRFDDDSNAITRIDEENQTAVTTGYINGEYVEFSDNYNVVQVITGTLAQPFGDYNINQLGNSLYTNNISIVLQVTTQAGTATMPLYSQENGTIMARFGVVSDTKIMVVSAAWIASGLDYCYLANGTNGGYEVTDVKSLASQFPVVATIVRHPLPEE